MPCFPRCDAWCIRFVYIALPADESLLEYLVYNSSNCDAFYYYKYFDENHVFSNEPFVCIMHIQNLLPHLISLNKHRKIFKCNDFFLKRSHHLKVTFRETKLQS